MNTRRSLLRAVAVTLLPVALHAQGFTGVAAVDSAAVARAAWARASEALRGRDVARAQKELSRAASAWPAQPTYLWADAVMSARVGDTTAALRALRRYTELGLGRESDDDTTFAAYAGQPAFGAALRRLSENSRSRSTSTVVGTLPDSTFWPEGVDYDPASQSYFVASVRHRTIARLGPNGAISFLWPPDGSRVGAILGVRVDTIRGKLWATTSGLPQMIDFAAGDSTIAALLEIRMSDGVIERRWDLPTVAGGHVLGDLAVGPNGDVFLTDSQAPVLYRLRPGADTLEQVRHPLFRSLQGLAPKPDGRDLYVADYSHGLLRVSLETGSVVRLDDATGSTSVGCDGLAWYRGAIIAVQNGVQPARIVRFVLDSSGSRITRAELIDRSRELAPEPTIGTVVGTRFVYVGNSLWNEFDDDGRMRTGARVTQPRLVAAPLPSAP